MLSGMLDRVPDLTLIIPHLGGVLPYLAQRLIDQSGRGDADHDLLYYLRRRIYLDTCSFHEPALVCAQDTVGTERIVIGSDYPFRGPITRCMDDIATLRLTASLSVRLW
jgi:aminocarboxymuconate-semialdehyde decarboxylase